MPMPTRRVVFGLKKKGFHEDNRHHHFFRYRTLQGKETDIVTKVSHGTSRGKKDLSDDLLSAMAQQCRLRRRELEDLILCPMTQLEYEDHLRSLRKIRSH